MKIICKHYFYYKNFNKLNILYINAQGFSDIKQNITLNNLIYKYDIVFIDHNAIQRNKNFVISIIDKKENRHTNGIYCFANPSIKNYIDILQVYYYCQIGGLD